MAAKAASTRAVLGVSVVVIRFSLRDSTSRRADLFPRKRDVCAFSCFGGGVRRELREDFLGRESGGVDIGARDVAVRDDADGVFSGAAGDYAFLGEQAANLVGRVAGGRDVEDDDVRLHCCWVESDAGSASD